MTETAEHKAEVAPDAILQLGFGFWGSKTLLSAVELGLFTELADAGPLDGEALRERLGLHPRSATDFLDALVALGMLEREDGRYANTPATDLYLDRAKPTYVGGMLEMANARLYRFWGSLTEGLRTGSRRTRRRRGERLLRDALRRSGAAGGVRTRDDRDQRGAGAAIAAKFPWARSPQRDRHRLRPGRRARSDRAGAPAPHRRRLRPAAGRADLQRVRRVGSDSDDRLSFTAGDFFADPLPTADVLVMGHILHDWDLDEKRVLLTKAYDALPDGGALIVYEALIDDERRSNAFGLLMSLNMLIETPGGFDYTGADCRAWMREAGLQRQHVEHLAGPDSMVVGIK